MEDESEQPFDLALLARRASHAVGAHPHILIVDDDLDFLELAEAAFKAEDLLVTIARTGGEAIVRAIDQPPDLILLDILLREADGVDVCEALRAEPETRDIPIVACTALGRRSTASLLQELGFDGVIAKPLNLAKLARAVKAALLLKKKP